MKEFGFFSIPKGIKGSLLPALAKHHSVEETKSLKWWIALFLRNIAMSLKVEKDGSKTHSSSD